MSQKPGELFIVIGYPKTVKIVNRYLLYENRENAPPASSALRLTINE